MCLLLVLLETGVLVLLEAGILVLIKSSILVLIKSSLLVVKSSVLKATVLSGGSVAKEAIVTESLLLPPQEILSHKKGKEE